MLHGIDFWVDVEKKGREVPAATENYGIPWMCQARIFVQGY